MACETFHGIGMTNANNPSEKNVFEGYPMHESNSPEIRRFKWRGQPHPVYYSPELAVRAHDHNYLLRLISDRIAMLAPARFCLLPQYRSLDPQLA
jgi:hypothetical protein